MNFWLLRFFNRVINYTIKNPVWSKQYGYIYMKLFLIRVVLYLAIALLNAFARVESMDRLSNENPTASG